MSILITGASGYVGSHLLQVLTEQEHSTLLTPSHRELDFSDYDCVDRYFAEHPVHQVVHCAACVDSRNRAGLFDSNVLSVFHLLKACAKYRVEHLLFISGNNVYGSGSERPYLESDACDPMPENSYGISKYCGDLMVMDYLRRTEVKYAIVRIADVYGPAQKQGALLKAITNNMKTCQPQKKYGIGDRTRDYIYIDDVAQGIAFVARNRLEGIYNLSTGVGTSVAELVRLAEEISPCKEPTIQVAVEKEDHSKVVLDNTKMKKAGFEPSVSIAEGLRRLAEYGGTDI